MTPNLGYLKLWLSLHPPWGVEVLWTSYASTSVGISSCKALSLKYKIETNVEHVYGFRRTFYVIIITENLKLYTLCKCKSLTLEMQIA
jgi:hypothetical protein